MSSQTTPRPLAEVKDRLADEQAGYTQGEDRPLTSFSAVVGIYSAAVAGPAYVVRRSGRPLPESVGPGDLALVSVATHKVSRLLAKDPVTSPLRPPSPASRGPRARPSWPRRSGGPALAGPWASFSPAPSAWANGWPRA